MLGFWRGLVGGSDFIIQGYQYPDLFYWHFGLLAFWVYRRFGFIGVVNGWIWKDEWVGGWIHCMIPPLVSKSNSHRVLVLCFAFTLVVL